MNAINNNEKGFVLWFTGLHYHSFRDHYWGRAVNSPYLSCITAQRNIFFNGDINNPVDAYENN